MTGNVSVRRVGANEASACVEALADVLVDCVEGGASVSFMLPLARDKAVEFWRKELPGLKGIDGRGVLGFGIHERGCPPQSARRFEGDCYP